MTHLKLIFFSTGLFLCASLAQADTLLFTRNNEFRGCIDCYKFDADSICNLYGQYGNRYSYTSIWNRYGAGGSYNPDSPFSRYGTGLKMVDNAGNFYGYFSLGFGGETRVRQYLNDLWNISDGDYAKMRDYFCEI